MKKQYVSLLAVLLSASGVFFSCGDKKKNVGELKFDSISVNQTTHLFGDTACPASNLTIELVYPTQASDEELKDTLTSYILTACFRDKYTGGQPQEVVKAYTQFYVDDYLRSLEPVYKEDLKNNSDKNMVGSWYSYYKHLHGSVQYYAQDLLVYKVHTEEYTGGAHGMYTTNFFNMDLNTLRLLQLDDLFGVPDYHEIVTDLIWNQLMAMHNVTSHEALEDLGYGVNGEVAPTENFYLSAEGITFYYNVYDIAPYSNGPVSVTIPFVMMTKILSTHPVLKELQN